MELNRSGVEWYFECLRDWWGPLLLYVEVDSCKGYLFFSNQNDSFLSEDPCGLDLEVLAISGCTGTWQST